jgi:SNF2 family DNA or RNA helicase
MDLLTVLLMGEFAKEPVVVSFRFNMEMFAAREILSSLQIPCAMIWGDLNTDQRKTETQKFWDGEVRVLLKQACVHYGMDLSCADTMIRYSMPEAWNDISQDMDRIVHPRKTRPLMYVDLICKDTVDEDVVEASRDKQLNARYFMERLAENFKKRLAAKETS